MKNLPLLEYRPGTDDDRWVIPELIRDDMYHINELSERLWMERGIVLDCGAHIGAFSTALAANGTRRPILAIEPQRDNFDLLTKNCHQYSNIISINAAVGLEDGEGSLLRPAEDSHTGRWRLGTLKPMGGVVPVLSLDRFLGGPIALLKLDLEGYEALLLKAFGAEITATVAILVVE